MIEHVLTVSIAWLLSLHQREKEGLKETGLTYFLNMSVFPIYNRKSTEISLAMKKTFETVILTELYPMSKIDIFVQVLQSDGSQLQSRNIPLSIS